MASPFSELHERLLLAGIAPRHVRRYIAELNDHLADLKTEAEHAGLTPADATTEALLRLGSLDHLASAMTAQTRLQSWSARAPWAIFGLVPLLLLAVSYFLGSSALWLGWKLFLPPSEPPFNRIDGFEIIFYAFALSFYTLAPVAIGWTIALLAVRQRLHLLWPAIGVALVALIGGLARVHAHRTLLHSGTRHISVSLALGPPIYGIPDSFSQSLMILAASALPYLVWRFHRRQPIAG